PVEAIARAFLLRGIGLFEDTGLKFCLRGLATFHLPPVAFENCFAFGLRPGAPLLIQVQQCRALGHTIKRPLMRGLVPRLPRPGWSTSATKRPATPAPGHKSPSRVFCLS